MTQEYNANYYSSSDLALVTALSLFYPIDSISKKNPHKALFVFKRNKSLDQLIQQYWQGKLKIEPAVYFNQLKTIKSRLYEERWRGG